MDCAPNCLEKATDHQIQSSLNDERPSRTLISIPRQSMSTLGRRKFASTCLINSRSLRNKAAIIKDRIVTNNFDLVAVTETWLNKDDNDKAVKKDITQLFLNLSICHDQLGEVVVSASFIRNNSMSDYKTLQHFSLLSICSSSLKKSFG